MAREGLSNKVETLFGQKPEGNEEVRHADIHSFQKYLLSTYPVPSTILDSWVTAANKADKKKSCPRGSHNQVGEETSNKCNNKFNVYYVTRWYMLWVKEKVE